MRNALTLLAVATLGIAVIGCGAMDERPDPRPGVTIPPAPVDPGTPSTPSTPKEPGAVAQTVVDMITLPTTTADFAMDFGDGFARNRLGAMMAAMRAALPQVDVQAALEKAMVARPLLIEVRASSTLSDYHAVMQGYVGRAIASNAGTAPAYTISPDDPGNGAIRASIQQGRLQAGPGLMAIPLPFGSGMLQVRNVEISVEINPEGLRRGVLKGALTPDGIKLNLMPLVHDELLRLYNTRPDLRPKLNALFDHDGNGKISFNELLDSAPVKLALTPDVDTDNDGKADSISFGVGFRARPVRIEHTLR